MSSEQPPVEQAPVTFASIGLRQELADAVAALGYEEPTPVQRETIPLLLEGRDLLGQAATGTDFLAQCVDHESPELPLTELHV